MSFYMVMHPSILLIEDSPGECELFRLALAQTGLDVTLHTEQDADTAFHFLECQWTAPAVVPLRESNEACSPSLSGLSGWSDGKFLRKNQRDQKDQPTEQTTVRVARAQDQADIVHSMPAVAPSLILLDLNLRGQDGCDLLKRLRSDARFATLPVVVFTTSDDQTDLARSYSCGANGYVVKPGTFDELVHCIGDLCRFWLQWNSWPAARDSQG